MTQDEIIKATIDAHDQMLKQLWSIAYEEGRKAEQARCCAIVYGQCESDNVAERTVRAIRARSKS